MSINFNGYDVPQCIDIQFFEAALKNGFNDPSIKVLSADFTGGTKPGENFCSQIRRATVTYSNTESNLNTVYLIVKYLGDDPMAQFFKTLKIFNREDDMYKDALTKIKEILGGQDIAPKYFYYIEEPVDVIIFEDVSPIGYKVGDTKVGLDEKHCELVLRKLGRYHAASLVLAQRYPEIFEKLKENVKMPKEDRPQDQPNFLENNFKHLAEIVATWPGFEETAKKIEKFVPQVEDGFDKWTGPFENELKVLAHNDLWTNNILFKYEDNAVKDLYFIDFQISFFSSPGIDLMHFLYTSPEFSVLEKRRDFMIESYYYKTLKSTLEDLAYSPIPTLNEILEEVKRREIVGFIWTMIQLYLNCIDGDDENEKTMMALHDAEKSRKLREAGMTSKRFTKSMKYILRQVEKAGVL